MTNYNLKSGDQLYPRSILIWRIVQTLVWLVGGLILFYLVFYPNVGIHLFWNILIPIAPVLFVVAVGVWRNVCPMASTALFPRHMGYGTLARPAPCDLIPLFLVSLRLPHAGKERSIPSLKSDCLSGCPSSRLRSRSP